MKKNSDIDGVRPEKKNQCRPEGVWISMVSENG
jgi:hypothetical protein